MSDRRNDKANIPLAVPPRIVVMGVCGCGKTTVGEALSERLGVPFRDGDDLHPKANVERMSAGTPLTDEDRWPWLALVGRALADAPRIIGCSALKRSYRDAIAEAAGGPVAFLHLSGTRAVIESRMGARQGHFMPTSLIDSQFAALEPLGADEWSVTVNIDQSLPSLLDVAADGLHALGSTHTSERA
ncbi:MAG: gluconokinase [Pseudomonadota bacterium]